MNIVLIEPGLQVVVVNTAHARRAEARVQIRAALCQLVGKEMGYSIDDVSIQSTPGCPPQLFIKGQRTPHGVSLSHAGRFACAAFNFHGAVGIDVTQVQDLPDMDRLALEYLGPEVGDLLGTVAPSRRADFFAHAWARREAHLKLLGQPLGEFIPLPNNCRVLSLPLPEGFAGAIAVQPEPAGKIPT